MMKEPHLKGTWIIVPVYNRRELTLGCLRHLQDQGVLKWSEVVVADGGSSDGTPEAVRREFPGIQVIEGRWWWMEGIRAGMELAQQRQAEVYVWLNDDCRPQPGSVERLVSHVRATSKVSGGITKSGGGAYAGMRKTSWGLKPVALPGVETGGVIGTDSLVGNFVAFPADRVNKAGLPDAVKYPHLCADHYYTMTLSGHEGCDLLLEAAAEDVHPGMGWERQSILRGEQPVSFIARQLLEWDARRGLLPELRFHRQFWGWKGWLIALGPWVKNWLLLGMRVVLPRTVRQKL